jgi:hypothetical protein
MKGVRDEPFRYLFTKIREETVRCI